MAQNCVLPTRVNAGGIILSIGNCIISGVITFKLESSFSILTRTNFGFSEVKSFVSGPKILTALSTVSTGSKGA